MSTSLWASTPCRRSAIHYRSELRDVNANENRKEHEARVASNNNFCWSHLLLWKMNNYGRRGWSCVISPMASTRIEMLKKLRIITVKNTRHICLFKNWRPASLCFCFSKITRLASSGTFCSLQKQARDWHSKELRWKIYFLLNMFPCLVGAPNYGEMRELSEITETARK